ncbi:MAG: type IV pilus secretin PilQ [Pseudomonadota bacterium]
MKMYSMWKLQNLALQALLACVLGAMAQTALAQAALQDLVFSALPGEQFEIRMEFNQAPPEPEIFVIDQPARLTLDFANTSSDLAERRFPLSFSTADSVMILEAQGRTRMVVNLNSSVPYRTVRQGNALIVVIGAEGGQLVTPSVLSAQDVNQGDRFVAPVSNGKDINGVDFRRGEDNAGMVVVDLANPNLSATVTQSGSRLLVEFDNANIEPNEQIRLDVTDFGTPVQNVSMYLQDGKVVVQADVTGQYEYLAYQVDGEYVVSINPVVAVTSGGAAAAADFNGDPISLNFQNIEVRALLQILADFNDFSLVVGDNVTGTITLRLDDVPWDQAVDMILRTRGLGQRRVGKVMYVAPADEIAANELSQLESSQQVEALAPLITDYIEVNYAEASDLLVLLQSGGGAGAAAAGDTAAAPAGGTGGLLTARGRASVDVRTNTIIVQDVEPVLAEVRALIARLDVPVRQVLIEARIVNATTSFSEALGIRWGGAQTFPSAGDSFLLSGSLDSNVELGNNLAEYNQTINTAVAGGQSLEEALATTIVQGPTFPQALVVDLGVDAPSSIALGYAGNTGLLQLELAALEASGNGEVIAQPKITTQDQQPANITSGVQIPYQSQAGGTSGGTTTEFVTAALSLQVTPQITPDGRIIMELDIHQDSVIPGSGAVPAIATNSVTTRVLVNNGDTVVLGGVFREEVTTSVTKTPVLGDLPYVGNLFKRTEDFKSKTELLIFITPSVINELL